MLVFISFVSAGDFPDWEDSSEDVIEWMHLHRAVQAFTAAVNLGPCVLLVDGIDLLTETLGLSKQEVIFQSPVAFNFFISIQ